MDIDSRRARATGMLRNRRENGNSEAGKSTLVKDMGRTATSEDECCDHHCGWW